MKKKLLIVAIASVLVYAAWSYLNKEIPLEEVSVEMEIGESGMVVCSEDPGDDMCEKDSEEFEPQTDALFATILLADDVDEDSILFEWLYKSGDDWVIISQESVERVEENKIKVTLRKNPDVGWLLGEYKVEMSVFPDSGKEMLLVQEFEVKEMFEE